MHSHVAGAIWWQEQWLVWPAGQSLLQVLWDAGVVVGGACQGRGQCALCRVRLLPLLHASPPAPVSGLEHNMLGQHAIEAGERLACQQRQPRFLRLLAAKEV